MVRINLLPVRVSKKKEAGKQQLVLFALVVVLAVIGNYVWSSARASDLAARERKLASTKAEIAQLDRIIGEVKNVRDQQQALREKLAVLAQLKQGRAGPVRMLDELATLTPKRLWLAKFEEKGGAVTLTGKAASLDDVSSFMTALKGSTHFRNVELAGTSAKGADKELRLVDFSLTANVVYATPAAAPGAAAPAPATPASAGAGKR
jgi:type IV pilus assembly protein PilN